MNAIINDLCLPIPDNAEGQPRRVGVELEFSYLDLEVVAALLIDEFGGTAHRETDYETRVEVPDLGRFMIEIDLTILKRLGRERLAQQEDPGLLAQLTEDLVREFAVDVVPCEIVTPPLTVANLARLDRLVAKLREAGAEGTDDSLVYAFGVQFNPEAPALTADSILAYLRAFVLLYDWLRSELGIDITRQLSTFIQPYPESYVQRILASDYAPDLAGLIDDYLAANSSRNRALDMLPLFSHLDEPRVRAVVGPDHVINARPTYHYRLPNSYVAHPDWRITDEWRYWLALEWLVADPERLDAMAAAYRKLMSSPLDRWLHDWVKQVPDHLPKGGPWCDL